MTARVALGSGISIARNGRAPRAGRLFLTSSAAWAQNVTAYPGFDSTANTIVANTATLAALMTWLTGKASGATVLICAPDPVVSGYPFDTAWQAALVGLGHAFTLSGDYTFNGHDPLAFDCVHILDAVAPPNSFGVALDAYLDARGAAFGFCQPNSHTGERYGVRPRGSAPYYHTATAAPDYLMTYPSLPFGGPSYQATQYTTSILEPIAGTRGGTMSLYNNSYGEAGMAAWVAE
jgi:hypothetical protein